MNGWNNDLNESISFNIIFQNAKILSWNCVNKNGHICRLNKKYFPCEYGYEEFYEYNNKKYVSIVCFGKKIKKGIYAPFVNIQFKNLVIYRYERSIKWFDKKTEQLAGENKILIDFSKLRKVFSNEMKDDPELIYEYEINIEKLKQLGIKMNYDDKNFDYFLSYSKI